MRFVRRLFNIIIRLVWREAPSRPEDIPKKLNSEALARAMQEAQYLRSQAVDVQTLAADELPGLPRRAD